MKTTFYLPLIAIIVFCSCKSSFTTQRYTHYKHTAAKKTDRQPEMAKSVSVSEEPVATEVVQAQPQKENFVLATVGSMKETIASFKPASPKNEFKAKEEVDNNAGKVVSQTYPEELTSKVTVNEKSGFKRGIIGSALETAIYIVLVVIFICLIIFLLSVIF